MTGQRVLTAVKLLVAAGLGAAYLALAALVAHPRVDAEYRSHYLDHTATCWLPEALRAGGMPPQSLQIGGIGYPEACRTLRLGWFDVEDWGVWARVPQAILNLPRRPGAGAAELLVRAAPPPNPAIRARFGLNGRATVVDVAPGATATVILPLPPPGEPHDPELRIAFENRATVPYPGHEAATREVGLGLVAIRYRSGTASGDEGPARPER